MPDLIRVVVADDQPVIRDGFAAVLDAQPDITVVGRAADGLELVDLVAKHRPDIALVDIRMPRMDGITAAGRISRTTKVLVLTTFDLDDYVRDALEAGASGFLLKDVPAARLAEGVRLVADGSLLLGPTVTRQLLRDAGRHPAPGPSLAQRGLTPREEAVFQCLARGCSNAEVAAELVVSVETVKSHVAEILRKLGLRDRVAVVVFAHENGLVEPVPARPGDGGVPRQR